MIRYVLGLLGCLYVLAAAGWVVSSGRIQSGENIEILNVACDPTRELWRDLNTRFIERYKQETGATVTIRQSHGGSGSQARAVIDGLEADVASLALWTDTDALRKAGLIAPGWESRLPNRSLPYTSTIVFVVRHGNPKKIRDWPDLERDDVQVVTPNPKTSGNGKWSFLGMWGSVLWHGGSEEQARRYVTRVYRQVPALDTAARGATLTFAVRKVGDVHLTWENEAYLEVQESGGDLEIIYPSISVLAEPHVAIVDRTVDRKGDRQAVEAYMKFLYTDAAQEVIAQHYHRPINPAILSRYRSRFPEVDLRPAPSLVATNSWDEIQKKFFAEGAVFDQIYSGDRGKR